MKGKLFVVATPIGNLGDITLRALETLKTVALILAEDTRHSHMLLSALGLKTPLKALHEHNEVDEIAEIKVLLTAGKNLALISDAGTPLISDPGFKLVAELKKADFAVIPIPGACAAISALSVSGLATNEFYFVGFLSAKAKARQDKLRSLVDLAATLIFYEAPHRVMKLLLDVAMVFKDREIVLAKELTKLHETIKSGTAQTILTWLQEEPVRQKGEFVLLVAGATEKVSGLEAHKVLKILLQHHSVNQAVKLAAEITGQAKNELYTLGLALTRDK